MQQPSDVVEFDQRRGFRLLRRRLWLILAVTVLLAIIGAAYGRTHRSYSATAIVRVAKPLAESLPGIARTATDDERAVANETQILQSTALQQTVAKSLNRKSVSVTVNPVANADVIDLTASAGTANTAAKIANSYANAYVNQRTTQLDHQVNQAVDEINKELSRSRAQLIALSGPHASGRASLRQTVIAHIDQLQAQETEYLQAKQIGSAFPAVTVAATPPHASSWRAPLEYGVIGALLGLLIGIFLASRVERSRPKVIDGADVSGLGSEPVRVFSVGNRTRSVDTGGAAIRSLAGWLLANADERLGRLYLLLAADGQSNQTLLADIHEQAALFGRRLAIVSTRFGEPASDGAAAETTLAQLLDVSDDSGASQVWRLGAMPDEGPGATLAAGAEPPNGRAALGSATMRDALRQMSQKHDAVLIDAADVDTCLLLATAAPTTVECIVTLAPRACERSEVAALFEELGAWRVPIPAVIFRRAVRVAAHSTRRARRRRPEPVEEPTPPTAPLSAPRN